MGRRQLLLGAAFGQRGLRDRGRTTVTPTTAAASPCGYCSSSVSVAGREVPVAVWYPANAAEAKPAITTSKDAQGPYNYFVSWGKLFRTLLGLPVPTFLGWGFQLGDPADILVDAPMARSGSPQSAVIFAHGYLGSRFDMKEICEGLARKGYVVAAPDFAECITASFEPTVRTSRVALVDAVVDKLRGQYGATRLGIFGHSAGGGSATIAEGSFPCGRVAVAGLRPGYDLEDPLLVIASKGDGVVPLNRVLMSIPRGTVTKAEPPLAEIASDRLAWLIVDGKDGRQPPCHVSFLSPAVADAMVTSLSPLLGLAKFLGVPVLDFDVYRELRDAEATTATMQEVIEAFFVCHSK